MIHKSSSSSPSPRSTTPGPITYVKAACHCGLNEFRAGFPTSALPISNDLCHCNACRHSSGQMAVYHVNVVEILCADSDEPFYVDDEDQRKGRSSPSGGDGDLIKYKTSDDAIRYFCSICSAQLMFRYLGKQKELGGPREGGYWCVAAGALEYTEGIVQPGYHIWIEDTLDGGMADHLRSVGDTELPRHRRGPNTTQLPLGWKATVPKAPRDLSPSTSEGSTSAAPCQSDASKHPSMDEELHFSCHCQTVQFKITRPNADSYLPHAAFPDLLYPYDITHLAKLRNSKDVKWWLRPLGAEKPTKYFAGHCACTYCRLTSGFEIQSWVYVPRRNIIVDSTGRFLELKEQVQDELEEVKEAVQKLGLSLPLAEDATPTQEKEEHATQARPLGLKQYISSPGRYREFCQNCGAAVFAWQAGRPDLICVAVGLVDEKQDGARAEGWFDWCLSRVGFSEQAVSPKTVEGMMDSLKAVQLEQEEKATSESLAQTTKLLVAESAPEIDSRPKDAVLTAVTAVEEVAASA